MRTSTFCIKIKTSLTAVLALLFMFPAAVAQEPPLSGLDEYIHRSMSDWEIPGLAVAVVKDDEIVYARGFGIRKLGEPEKVDEHTLFGIASTTKAMTAAALGMLVDEGKIDWDDPIIRYLPEFQVYSPFVTSEITIRDALTHRSGLGRMLGNRLQFMTSRSREEVMYRMRYMEPEQSFRSSYVYSNLMYMVAGQIIEAVEGISWDEFVRQRIFQPLGMAASNTSITQIADDANAAWPHQEIRGEIVHIPRRNWDNAGPAASVNSSVYEMAQWMRLQLGRPGEFEGQRLISEAVMREMHQGQIALPVSDPYGGLASYGLGWHLSDHRGIRTLSHGGATDGMNTSLTLVPSENLGIVVLTNVFNNLTTAIVNRVIDMYTGAPETDWSERNRSRYHEIRTIVEEWRDDIESVRKPDTRPSFPLEAYTGRYHDDLYDEVEVILRDGNLELHFWEDPDLIADLEHWHHDTFRAHWRNPAQREKFVYFTINRDGEIGELNIRFTLRPILLQVGIYPTNYYRDVRFVKR